MATDKILGVVSNVTGPAVGGVLGAVAGVHALSLLGFGTLGPVAGSIAAGIQAGVYGAAVPAGGWFATATSWGATGAVVGPMGMIGAAAAGATAYGIQWYLL